MLPSTLSAIAKLKSFLENFDCAIESPFHPERDSANEGGEVVRFCLGRLLLLDRHQSSSRLKGEAPTGPTCRMGYTTLFFRMNTLVEQLTLARAKGTYLKLIKRLAGCDLLVLDDLGIKPLEPQDYQDLHDVVDERGEGRSIIVTSQLPVENWSEIIADPVTREAAFDRLSSASIRLVMQGVSHRPKRPRKPTALDKD